MGAFNFCLLYKREDLPKALQRYQLLKAAVNKGSKIRDTHAALSEHHVLNSNFWDHAAAS